MGISLIGLGLRNILWSLLHETYTNNQCARSLHKLSLVAGALSFMIFLAFMQEMDKNRPDNTTGMSFVGIAAIIGLISLRRRLKRVSSKKERVGEIS